MHFCILHVENVGQDIVATEVEEAGAEGQEEQQEFEVADQVEEQALEANFANSDPQQGKPRFIDPMSYKFMFMQASIHFKSQSLLHKSKFHAIYLNILVHYVYRSCLIPRCMR